MDPDLVRQQEEAEREARMLRNAVPPRALRPVPPAQPAPAQPAEAPLPSPSPGSAPQPVRGETAEMPPEPPRTKQRSSLIRFGRFLSFAIAGAMLGGGIGIALAQLLPLEMDYARLAIFGGAGAMAAVCGFASFLSSASATARP